MNIYLIGDILKYGIDKILYIPSLVKPIPL